LALSASSTSISFAKSSKSKLKPMADFLVPTLVSPLNIGTLSSEISSTGTIVS
tara:strand:- start:1289 stop:1447 length:159 start_codon:yes stop_codon:yes gene_type:complete